VRKDLPFEVVFVSSDRDEKSFKDYLGEMPWIALPYDDRRAAGKLDTIFEVQGIPTFVIVDAEGNTITKNGRGIPKSDPEGLSFPWHPPAVKDLAGEDAPLINESTALIVLAEGADDATLKGLGEALEGVAKRTNEAAKAKGSGDAELLFFLNGKAGGAGAQIRKLCSLPATISPHEHPLEVSSGQQGWGCDGCGQQGHAPVAIILDIPDNGGYYANPFDEVNAESLGKFVEQYQTKTLTRKQLGE
jgi:nucleoredoxin